MRNSPGTTACRAGQQDSKPASQSASQRELASQPASQPARQSKPQLATRSELEAARAGQSQRERQIVRQDPASEQAGRPDKYAASRRSERADSSFSSQQQLAAGGSQPASRQQGCSSRRCFALRVPGGNQVDGLPPVPTYRCRINRRLEVTARKRSN